MCAIAVCGPLAGLEVDINELSFAPSALQAHKYGFFVKISVNRFKEGYCIVYANMSKFP